VHEALLLGQKLGDRAVPESWTTTVPLKGVLHLLSDAEQARLKLTPRRRVQGTLFLVSMEALSELLHHTVTHTQGQGLGSWSYLQHHRGAPHAGHQPLSRCCTWHDLRGGRGGGGAWAVRRLYGAGQWRRGRNGRVRLTRAGNGHTTAPTLPSALPAANMPCSQR